MMEPTFEKLLVLLAKGEVKFVLVGGVAVSLHGDVRLTEDVGILVAPSAENNDRLLATLAQYGEGFARELSPTIQRGISRIVTPQLFMRSSPVNARHDDKIAG